jgi:MFS transporter, OFA family, oxalate/formate antiporter
MAPLFGLLLEILGYVSMNLWLAWIALFLGLTFAQLTGAPEQCAKSPKTPRKKSSRLPVLTGPAVSLREAFRSGPFWFLWSTWALMGAAGIAMVFLAVPFGVSRGAGSSSAVMILTAFNLTNGFSRLIMGYLSDKISRTAGMSLTFLVAGCAYLLLPYVTGLGTATLLAAVIGFAFGTLFAVSAPLAVDCFGLKHFGAIYGLVFTAYGFLAGAIGPSLSGYLLDATDANFSIVFSYLGFFCLISSFLIRRVHPVVR